MSQLASSRAASLRGVACATALLLCACASPFDPGERYDALIRRSEGGIPHIRAEELGSLGFGTLYAMAEDNVCALADQYLGFAAERSLLLGPEDGNLESDFFYRLFIDRGQGAEPLPAELNELFEGAAAGYNHYLRETGVEKLPDARCRGASWVREVTPLDVKRVSRADYALAYMLPMLMAAAPPEEAEGDELARAYDPVEIAALLARTIEAPKEGGSNAIAIGREASQSGGGMLLANPHMPWNEPSQRFYPMHQTVPGRFDVLGATLLGRPRVGFGHNATLAWTSTVSTAKRLTFYQLELVPGDPTRYRFDGEARKMRQEQVRVRVRNASGEIEERSHTFYSTHFGAYLVESEHFAWTEDNAIAVRSIDAGWRGELSGFEQLAAKSVRELKAIHDRSQFLTVNLIAADLNGEVLYGDLGPVPHVSDAKAESCAVLRGAATDGSRSACQWGSDPDAAVPGIFGPSKAPFVFRSDFVTNSNDSHWLPNPARPLVGYPRIYGNEATPRTLRTRSGLRMLRAKRREPAVVARGGLALEDLQQITLANESYAGQILRDPIVAACRARPGATLEDGTRVSLAAACEVLARWDLHANLDSRGAHLFRELLSAANSGRYTRWRPALFLPATPFDPASPVDTPRGLAPEARPAVLAALAQAVRKLEQAGIALDAPLGALQGVLRNDARIPLHGGPESEGIFNKLEARFQGERGYPDVTSWSSSWILAVDFGQRGVRSSGILTYSLSMNPDSPHFADQTRMFSDKQWLALPFREADVEAAALRRTRVGAPREESR